MLSEQTFYLLSLIPEDGLPEDQFPCNCSLSDFKDLESRGLVIVATLIPPGTECPGGMCYVRLTSAGRDTLAKKQRAEQKMVDEIARQQADDEARAAERAADKRREFWYFVAGLILGWLLGFVSPVNLLLWFCRSASLIWSMLH